VNYRHAFHAGNFADVFKHVLLTRILIYLARKETPFRVIDTHAGEGGYDLQSDEAIRGGEWRNGIGRLGDLTDADEAARDFVRPFLDIVGPLGAEGQPPAYPGSPSIIQALTRPQDRATFYELHPDSFAELRARFRRDERIACVHLDGYKGLSAGVPPKERRGLVLIDPPYERANELDLAWAALSAAHAKWQTGIYALWYPVKDARTIASFVRQIAQGGVRRVLRLELAVDDVTPGGKLARAGLILVNPPHVLDAEASVLLPMLARKLARSPRAAAMRERVAGE
jgi:23S rRNA (adenine2030-N6)-methyltransferase